MKIQAAKQDLNEALAKIEGAIAKGGADISNHVVFRATGGNVEILAAHSRLFSGSPLVCQCDVQQGAFTVLASSLKRWLGAVSDAALEFEFSAGDSEVTAKAPRGEVRFQSLDPDSFTFWDQSLKDVAQKAVIPAHRIKESLDHVKRFVCLDESAKPQFTVTEICDGRLFSTNMISASMVTVDGMSKAEFRVQGKDLAPLSAFLKRAKEEEIEVLEDDRALILRRPDGSHIGVTRPRTPMPPLVLDNMGEPTHWWEMQVSEVSSGIDFVQAVADAQDPHLGFEDDGTTVTMWMRAPQSTKRRTELRVTPVDRGAAEGAAPLEGFLIHVQTLLKVLKSCPDDTIRFNLYVTPDRGFLTFDENRHGDDYRTVLTFVR